MKKIKCIALGIAVLITTAFTTTSAQEVKGNYPSLEAYEAHAELVLKLVKDIPPGATAYSISVGLKILAEKGLAIMKVYQEKYPSCEPQFAVMFKEAKQIEAMTHDDAYARYHDAVGLPEAPRHCYLGRSQVIHPNLSLIRMNRDGWTKEVKASVWEEIEEVIHHLDRIQIKLDTP